MRVKHFFSLLSIVGLVLVLIAGVTYHYAISQDLLFPKIKELAKNSTGLRLQKSGLLEVSLLPLAITIRKFEISNPADSSDVALLETERLTLALEWSALFRADIIVDVDLDTTNINLQIDESGRPNWSTPELQGESSAIPIRLGQVNAINSRLRFQNYQSNELLGLDLEQIDIDLEQGKANAKVDSAGRFGNTRFVALGELKYNSNMEQLAIDLDVSIGEAPADRIDTIEVPSINDWAAQNSSLMPVKGKIHGLLSISENLPYGALTFTTEIKALQGLSYLNENLEYLRSDTGPIIASGVLQLNGSDVDITGLQSALHQEKLDIEINGDIQNLLSEIRLNLSVVARMDTLDQLLVSHPLSSVDQGILSRIESTTINTTVIQDTSGFHLDDIDVQFQRGSFKSNVTGKLRVTDQTLWSTLDIKSEAARTQDLFELLGFGPEQLNDLQPFTISASLSGENDDFQIEHGNISIKDSLINASISGEVKLADGNLNFNLDNHLDVRDFASLATVFPEAYRPYLEGVNGSVRVKLKGSREAFSATNLKLALSHQDRKLGLSGAITRLPDKPASNLDFRYSTTQALNLEQYFSELTGLKISAPIEFAGNIQSIDEKISIQQIQLLAGKTDIEGMIKIDLGREPARIKAILGSNYFSTDLVKYDPELPEQEATATELANASETEIESETESEAHATLSSEAMGQRFKAYNSSIELSTEWIDQLDLNFDFLANNAQLGSYTTENLALSLRASEGVFELHNYELLLEGKPVSFRGSINTKLEPPAYELIGELEGDTLEALLNAKDGLFEGGELSTDFRLNSEGEDLGELISNLHGTSLFTLGPLSIRSTALDMVSSSIFSTMLGGMVKKENENTSSAYECGVLGIDISNGLASVSKSFTMQAKEYNLAGNGRIDLNTGIVDIKVAPKARKGLGLSISTLVGGFKIKGNMATPDFGVGGGSLVSAALVGYALSPVALGAALNPVTATMVATGFLVSGLADRLTAANYTCEKTLERIKKQRSQKGKSSGKGNQKRYF